MIVSDSEIVNFIQNDHSRNKGMQLMMTRYQERLYWVIKNIVESHDDTDDVLQNTFIKAYRNISGFESRSSLFTWLYRIATNEALTYKKTRQKKSTVAIVDQSAPVYGLSSNDNSEEDVLRKLNLALEELPERQKQVFKMRYYDELSYEEMGQLLDLSEGALKASYHHAIKKIEQYLVEYSTH